MYDIEGQVQKLIWGLSWVETMTSFISSKRDMEILDILEDSTDSDISVFSSEEEEDEDDPRLEDAYRLC